MPVQHGSLEKFIAQEREDLMRLIRLLLLGVIIAAALLVISVCTITPVPRAEGFAGAELTSLVYNPQTVADPTFQQAASEANPARTVVTAGNVAVPLLTQGSERSYVGAGTYLQNGMPAPADMAVFSLYSLLMPGQPVVEDEYKMAIPHLVEVRIADPEAMPLDTPLLAVIWDADGDGTADYIAHAMADPDMKFHHWRVYRIVGEKPSMSEVDLKLFLELTPDPEGWKEA